MVHNKVTKFWILKKSTWEIFLKYQHISSADHKQIDMNMPVRNIFITPIVPTETKCKYFQNDNVSQGKSKALLSLWK